jgi:hypothetical protein
VHRWARPLTLSTLVFACACGGKTQGSPTRTDGSVLPHSDAIAPSPDSGEQSDAMSSGIHDSGLPDRFASTDAGVDACDGECAPLDDGGPLSDACAALFACCSFVPQVVPCIPYVTNGPSSCSGTLSIYVTQGYIDGGPCVGMGHGTPACASLSACCDSPTCEHLIEAGDQSGCLSEYNTLENDGVYACTPFP